jgi:hypothetical protein
MFSFDYFIFIGRREPLSQAEMRLKNAYKQSRDVDVATYDRLLGPVNTTGAYQRPVQSK